MKTLIFIIATALCNVLATLYFMVLGFLDNFTIDQRITIIGISLPTIATLITIIYRSFKSMSDLKNKVADLEKENIMRKNEREEMKDEFSSQIEEIKKCSDDTRKFSDSINNKIDEIYKILIQYANKK